MLATNHQTIETTFTFFGHIPSKKNSKRLISGRVPRLISSAAYLEWEKRELLTLRDAPKLYPPYSLDVSVFPGSMRSFDLSNQLESLNDLLVKAGVLEDDNWLALQAFSVELGELDIENPHTIYRITSIRHQNSIANIKEHFNQEAKLQRKLSKIKARVKV
jgi:Holliday junction resolvase RusA-like endonuclease